MPLAQEASLLPGVLAFSDVRLDRVDSKVHDLDEDLRWCQWGDHKGVLQLEHVRSPETFNLRQIKHY